MKTNRIIRFSALVMLLAFMLAMVPSCSFADPKINGVELEKYSIVYNSAELDYNKRAAEYIQSEIKSITGIELEIKTDDGAKGEHEIVVGETNREISDKLDEETEGLEFSIMADEASIALEAESFVIAAAAYYFVSTYVTGRDFDTSVSAEAKVEKPIVKEAKNFILLIGDGMGYCQTKLFDAYDVPTEGDQAYSDGEDIFYGYMLPYEGASRTASLDGVTDSAAGGTALATGYKTHNSYIGKDKDGNDLRSLTELAASMGMASAVMSTESKTGATPATFSAHAIDRDGTTDITTSQIAGQKEYGTVIKCGYESYLKARIKVLENAITETLGKVSANEKGFFMMYEEAHIDKSCHQNDMDTTFHSLMRFNQAIGRIMEFAFYNPDTFVLITADHETGGMYATEDGFAYTIEEHSLQDVPVFAYGVGAELFDGVTVENTQIAKTIASLMGAESFGDPDQPASLVK